jgi:hypothetical protein
MHSDASTVHRVHLDTNSRTIRCMSAQAVEHEQPDGGGKIALLAGPVDFSDHVRQRGVLTVRDLLQAAPKCIFETDAGLMSTDNDGPFDDWRFHKRFLLQRHAPNLTIRFLPKSIYGRMANERSTPSRKRFKERSGFRIAISMQTPSMGRITHSSFDEHVTR